MRAIQPERVTPSEFLRHVTAHLMEERAWTTRPRSTGPNLKRRAAFERTLKEISGRLHAFIALAAARTRA